MKLKNLFYTYQIPNNKKTNKLDADKKMNKLNQFLDDISKVVTEKAIDQHFKSSNLTNDDINTIIKISSLVSKNFIEEYHKYRMENE